MANPRGGKSTAKMTGKGSKRRPQQVKDDAFDNNWNNIFGNKSMEPQTVNEPLSRYFSANGAIEALVCKVPDGFLVETYKKNKLVETSKIFSFVNHAENHAEDIIY